MNSGDATVDRPFRFIGLQGEYAMLKSFACAITVLSLAITATVSAAQPFEKKNYNYSDWTKGRFSEAVTVTGPAKMIFLAGVGSEDENGKGGDILHKVISPRSANMPLTKLSVLSTRTEPRWATL
jgi:hypothetical protein